MQDYFFESIYCFLCSMVDKLLMLFSNQLLVMKNRLFLYPLSLIQKREISWKVQISIICVSVDEIMIYALLIW